MSLIQISARKSAVLTFFVVISPPGGFQKTSLNQTTIASAPPPSHYANLLLCLTVQSHIGWVTKPVIKQTKNKYRNGPENVYS